MYNKNAGILQKENSCILLFFCSIMNGKVFFFNLSTMPPFYVKVYSFLLKVFFELSQKRMWFFPLLLAQTQLFTAVTTECFSPVRSHMRLEIFWVTSIGQESDCLIIISQSALGKHLYGGIRVFPELLPKEIWGKYNATSNISVHSLNYFKNGGLIQFFCKKNMDEWRELILPEKIEVF